MNSIRKRHVENMKLRWKVLGAVGVVFSLLLAMFYMVMIPALLDDFKNIEERDAETNTNRVILALETEKENLNRITYDWAAWDDTYWFVQNNNSDYVDTNLYDDYLGGGLGYNMVLYFDNNSALVFSKVFDVYNWTETNLTKGIREQIINNPILTTHNSADSNVTGFVILPEGPMLLCSRPILNSLETSPIAGTMIFGYYFDPVRMRALGNLTQLEIFICEVTRQELPSGCVNAIEALSSGEDTLVERSSSNTLTSYRLVDDVNGEPGLILRVRIDRHIYSEGERAVRDLGMFMHYTALIVLVATLIIMEIVFVRRTSRLTRDVTDIGKRKDAKGRIPAGGSDEIGMLGREINGMIEAMAQAEGRYEYLFNKSDAVSLVVDRKGRIISINESSLKHFGFESSMVEGKFLSELVLPEYRDKVDANLARLWQGGQSSEMDIVILDRKGQERTIMISPSGVSVHKMGKRNGVLITGLDVTARKVAEEQLIESLKEKEVLIREVHHRVKNNLAIIISIIHLQMRGVSDQHQLENLDMIQNRIKSMAMVHEMLYKSDHLADIELGEYLKSLGSFLVMSHRPAGSPIEYTTETENIRIDIDHAINSGLIVNELVLNAIKHAFPDGEGGTITLKVSSSEDIARIEVCDDGVGIPAEMEIDKLDSLGMKLVRTLVRQLDGTVEIVRNGGSRFVIEFPIA